jgi:hypothetical protein
MSFYCLKLRSLNLFQTTNWPQIAEQIEMLRFCNKIEHLNVDSSQLSEEFLTAASKYLTHLRSVTLSKFSVHVLFRIAQNNRFLETIHLKKYQRKNKCHLLMHLLNTTKASHSTTSLKYTKKYKRLNGNTKNLDVVVSHYCFLYETLDQKKECWQILFCFFVLVMTPITCIISGLYYFPLETLLIGTFVWVVVITLRYINPNKFRRYFKTYVYIPIDECMDHFCGDKCTLNQMIISNLIACPTSIGLIIWWNNFLRDFSTMTSFV